MVNFDPLGRRARRRADAYQQGLALIAREQPPPPDLHLVQTDETPGPLAEPSRNRSHGRKRAATAGGASAMLIAATAAAVFGFQGTADPNGGAMLETPSITGTVEPAIRSPRRNAGPPHGATGGGLGTTASGNSPGATPPPPPRPTSSSPPASRTTSPASSTPASSTTPPATTSTTDRNGTNPRQGGHKQDGGHERGLVHGVLNFAAGLLG